MDTEKQFFRVLRADEELCDIRAKDFALKLPSKEELHHSIERHIKSGSSGYRSPWISTTANLNVALAFSSVILRVAKMSDENLRKERKEETIFLDKDYLSTILTERDLILRSKRSDEVLIFRRIKCAESLSKDIQTVQRTLHPEFVNDDAGIFPEITPKTNIEATEMLAGPNKGLFRIKIDGKSWIARLPRPNYDLEKDVLFDKEIVQLCQHQFVILSLYRSLGAPVPRCVLYRFDVVVKDFKQEYSTALLLFEDMKPCKNADDALEVAQEMYPMDILLGNWDPIEGAKSYTELISSSTGSFFVTKDGETVRLSVDRAMGCIYPEDRAKSDKHIVEFECGNLGLLRKTLQNEYPWCYGCIPEKDFIEMTIDVTTQCKWDKINEVLALTSGLPWIKGETKEKYIDILEERKKEMLAYFPYDEVTPSNKIETDEHGVALGNTNKKEIKQLGILWKFGGPISRVLCQRIQMKSIRFDDIKS